MISIIKNNFNRLLGERGFLYASFIMSFISIAIAIAFTNFTGDSLGNFAFLSKNSQLNISSPYATITKVEEIPPMSELVRNRYDAVIIIDEKGDVTIQSIKSEELEMSIKEMLINPNQQPQILSNKRGPGTNILGFLMLFLLFEGVVLISFFSEDKEQKLIGRILISSLPTWRYISGNILFTSIIIYAINIPIIFLVQFIPGVDIGFTIFEYIIFIGIIGLFGTIFGLFISAIFQLRDSSLMIGSAIIVLTTILSGSFYSFEKGNKILTLFVQFLPQKIFMTFVDNIEKGREIFTSYTQPLIFLCTAAILFVIAIIKINSDIKTQI